MIKNISLFCLFSFLSTLLSNFAIADAGYDDYPSSLFLIEGDTGSEFEPLRIKGGTFDERLLVGKVEKFEVESGAFIIKCSFSVMDNATGDTLSCRPNNGSPSFFRLTKKVGKKGMRIVEEIDIISSPAMYYENSKTAGTGSTVEDNVYISPDSTVFGPTGINIGN